MFSYVFHGNLGPTKTQTTRHFRLPETMGFWSKMMAWLVTLLADHPIFLVKRCTIDGRNLAEQKLEETYTNFQQNGGWTKLTVISLLILLGNPTETNWRFNSLSRWCWSPRVRCPNPWRSGSPNSCGQQRTENPWRQKHVKQNGSKNLWPQTIKKKHFFNCGWFFMILLSFEWKWMVWHFHALLLWFTDEYPWDCHGRSNP